MIFTPLTGKQYEAAQKPLRGLIRSALCRCPELRDRMTTELLRIEYGIREGNLMPVAIREPQPVVSNDAGVVGILILELFSDNLHVRIIAGKFKKGWLDEVIPLLVRIAKSRGKDIIRCRGRKGWSKLLVPYGFEADGKLMRYEL